MRWGRVLIPVALAFGLAAPFIGPQIFSGGGIVADSAPVPHGLDSLIMDTRLNGAQNIQTSAVTTITNLQTVTGTANSSNGYAVDIATGFEHSDSGRAWRINQKAGIGALALIINKAGLDIGGTFCYSVKLWNGETAGGGHIAGSSSTVGAFAPGPGHKWDVIFYRDTTGGNSTNVNRHTDVLGQQDGSTGGNTSDTSFFAEVDEAVYKAGIASGAGHVDTLIDNTHTAGGFDNGHFELVIWKGTGSIVTTGLITKDVTDTLIVASGLPITDATSRYDVVHVETNVTFQDKAGTYPYGGLGVAPNVTPAVFTNGFHTVTSCYKQESVPGAADGFQATWIDNQRMMGDTTAKTFRTGAPPLRWKELQLFVTWNAGPAFDMTSYYWDWVIWKKKTPGGGF